ncbi:SDR family NAD(P)-dependent oxidoreductase [Agilicoccus flavus]|uniref:SDR family NAD(P)-dependent oxidoreductase n=1 Tax=Agilicoccus flavus TaxID=2775968 RepID=UPI001CF6560E|nr:SDR family NAD(P)-dependent oxidoreductase [Agilicoccus flavus]
MSAPEASTPDLTGRVVVVAGAAGAAGPPLVSALAVAGAHVVAAGRDAARLAPVVDAATAAATAAGSGGRAQAAVVDLLDEAAISAWAAGVRAEHGRVDGLVHLVGGWRGGKGIVGSDLADWAWLQDMIVVTLAHTTRAFHDDLVSSGGRLAIVSTVQVEAPTATNAAYAAAKAAAEAWTLAVGDSFARAASGAGRGVAEAGNVTADEAARPAAAAVIVRVKALLTDVMRAAKPDAAFSGYTHVDDLATRLTRLWDTPADELVGRRETLVP